MGNSESSSSQFPLGKHNGADEEEDDVSFLQICAAVAWTALLAFGALKLATSLSSKLSTSSSSELSTSSSSELSTSSSSSSDDDLEEREALYPRGWVNESRRDGGRSAYSETFGNTNQYISSKMIKIMSYNVWRKDIEIPTRMRSISKLVLKHTPDVILFQEITQEIYEIFEAFDWWHSYKCSFSADESTTKNIFPMLLSKLPAEFLNSRKLKKAIGKEIIVAKIDPGLQEELYVATIHLKSPAFPQMHREERTAQAEKAIKLLNPLPNIVFGGDMNWDDDSDGDGPFPLLDGWVDAWTELRDDEHGWTFDTKANPMLKGHIPLQKRLDRFMCRLRDFRLVSVEMIGLEAIPGLYSRNTNGRMAPVLPSDHFGLLLTICLK